VSINISARSSNDYGGHLYYKERICGINLEFSSSPQYWRKIIALRGGLGTREQVRLYNTVAGSSVVYYEREYGINWKWQRDRSRKTNNRYPPFCDRVEF
jgi:hypothetical protein